MQKNILVTAGAGFIGFHVVRLFVNKYPDYKIINLEALTYAGNLENLKDIEGKPNYFFEKVNILDTDALANVFKKHDVTDIIHLAAESHVDHSVRAYGETYNIPYVITNCSNNYGPNHFPEKLIPLFINNIINKKPLPVYGKGANTRDWLYVIDHARAIDIVFHKGKNKETYNVGGFNEWKNIDLVKLMCKLMVNKLGRAEGER